MFENLKVLQTSFAMARHAGTRQAITAANMANADTPNYRAQSIAPFSETFDGMQSAGLRATRTNHLQADTAGPNAQITFSDAESSPNGNTVSLEQEMINSVEIQREHNRALAIYKHSLDVLRLSIGRR